MLTTSVLHLTEVCYLQVVSGSPIHTHPPQLIGMYESYNTATANDIHSRELTRTDAVILVCPAPSHAGPMSPAAMHQAQLLAQQAQGSILPTVSQQQVARPPPTHSLLRPTAEFPPTLDNAHPPRLGLNAVPAAVDVHAECSRSGCGHDCWRAALSHHGDSLLLCPCPARNGRPPPRRSAGCQGALPTPYCWEIGEEEVSSKAHSRLIAFPPPSLPPSLVCI